MPNLAALLKSEISRLAKKEVRKEVLPLRKVAAGYRREIAQLKRTLASLQRTTKQLAKPRSSSVVSVRAERSVRFVAKGLVSLRKRLGISADQMARLLGVSMQSVYNWERKKATPRKEQVAAIVALRGIGKKEAHQRLGDADKKGADKRTLKRPSRKRGATRRAAKSKWAPHRVPTVKRLF
jgi:DNA-binding transcriptional regulator YiaG